MIDPTGNARVQVPEHRRRRRGADRNRSASPAHRSAGARTVLSAIAVAGTLATFGALAGPAAAAPAPAAIAPTSALGSRGLAAAATAVITADSATATTDPIAAAARRALGAAVALDHLAGAAPAHRADLGPLAAEAVAQARASADGARNEVADLVAGRVGTSASALRAAWTSAGPVRRTVVLTALAQVGDRYRADSSGPNTFDCSGLTAYAWRSVGIELPRKSNRQLDKAARRSASTVRPGDLVYRPGHVMLALGGDVVVHAPHSGALVSVASWGRTTRFGSPLIVG